MAAESTLSPEEIDRLFSGMKADALEAHGGVKGVASKLGVDVDRGLSSAEQVAALGARYGHNRLPEPPSRTFFQLVLEGLSDKTLIMLMVAAVISLVLGIIEAPATGWIEGTAILAAVAIVVLVSSANDYSKEKQFRQLNARKNNKAVKVIRRGEMEQISVYDVVVGDVVVIDTGDILCADALFLTGYNIKCDESTMTGESDQVKKSESAPFMLSSTQVVDGVGRMLVLAVGTRSTVGKTMVLLQRPAEDTPLQVKLEVLADRIAKFGIGAAAAIFVVLVAKLAYGLFVTGTVPFTFAAIFGSVVKYIVTAVTVVVVAVPEGLPLAVTIALAYSMKQMLYDQNLVRRLEACETMGGATTICSDKTGTLTTNRMTVTRAFVAGTLCDDVKDVDAAMGPAARLLWFGIAANSTASEATNDKGVVEFVGSKTECALLAMARAAGQDFEQLRRDAPKAKLIPFSSARKRMATIARVGGELHLFVKGASEIVLARCTKVVLHDGIADLDDEQRAIVNRRISEFASQSLRTICLAYKPIADNDSFALNPNATDEENDRLENDLILLGLCGIKDPLRSQIKDAIVSCAQAGIVVRMVTGDNVETARAIALESGILTDGVVIEGPAFRALSDKERDEVAPRLQVMARSSPTDKFMLVQALKRQGHVVAVTGDGTNDAPALKEAHVGFAMGITGTEVSKEASDIILLDDNFQSIVMAAMWGRNVFSSIRKFLQFQLTVNLTAVCIAFIGAVSSSHGEPPLKPVQMLWLNLIMDTLAALALATDAPSPDLLKKKPYGKDDSLITRRMALNVAGQGIFQLAVNLSVLYLGPQIFGVERESVTHLTCVFNTFVLCQLVNEVNSRVLDTDINVFRGFFRNNVFIAVIATTSVLQFLIVQYGGDFASTRALTSKQWLTCIGIAVIGFPIGVLLKFIPIAEPEKPTVQAAEPSPAASPASTAAAAAKVVRGPRVSAKGAAAWQKVSKQRGKLAAVSAFKKAGLAAKIRRIHRLVAIGFESKKK